MVIMYELSPRELVDGLQRSMPDARAALEWWFRTPVQRLVAQCIPRHPLAHLAARVAVWRSLSRRRGILVDRTLRWIEMYLRCRDASIFGQMSHDVFRAQVLVAASRMLSPPSTPIDKVAGKPWKRSSAGASGIKPAGSYGILIYSQPLQRVGGDWSDADIEPDGSLWVVVSDVTSHGDIAYVMARALAELWQTRNIAGRRRQRCRPCEILDAISQELEQVLPDDVFVEAVLAHYAPDGRVIAGGAGNCRLIVRRAGSHQIDMRALGGLLLGMGSGERDQSEFVLHTEDEVALASDGLFEQWSGDCRKSRLDRSLATRLAGHLSSGKVLHDAILIVLDDALRSCRQHDDITVVTVRFDGHPSAAEGGGHVAL
jgi:hypothetical protein